MIFFVWSTRPLELPLSAVSSVLGVVGGAKAPDSIFQILFLPHLREREKGKEIFWLCLFILTSKIFTSFRDFLPCLTSSPGPSSMVFFCRLDSCNYPIYISARDVSSLSSKYTCYVVEKVVVGDTPYHCLERSRSVTCAPSSVKVNAVPRAF